MTVCVHMQVSVDRRHINGMQTYGTQVNGRQIVVYGLPNHDTPLAIIPSKFWANLNIDQHLDPELGHWSTKVVGIRQYPIQKDELRHMKLLLEV